MRKFTHKTGFSSPNIDYIIYEDNNPNKLGKVVYSDGTSLPCSSTLKEAEGHVQRNVWVEVTEKPMKTRKFKHRSGFFADVEYAILKNNEFFFIKTDGSEIKPSQLGLNYTLNDLDNYLKNGWWIEIKEPKIRRFTHSCKQIFLNQGVEYIEFDTEKPNDCGIMYPSKIQYIGDLKRAEDYVKQGFWVEIPVEEKQVKTAPVPKFKPGETVYIKYSNKIVCGTIEYSIFTGGQWAYYVHGFVEALAEVCLQSTPPALDN